MKNSHAIAVGINDSVQSQAAVAWAAQRAKKAKLPLVLLHVVDDRWFAEPRSWQGVLWETGEKLLERTAVDTRENAAVEVTTSLLNGSVGGSLGKYSRKASMLVVGSGSAHMGGALTDRALQVAAAARCPVAVVGTQDLDKRSGIVVGVDGSEEALQAVAFAAAEADRQGEELTVVHAYSDPERLSDAGLTTESMRQIKDEQERLVLAESVAGLSETYPDLKINKVIDPRHGPVRALLDASSQASMLVVGNRGRGGFKRLLLGSTAHGVLAHLQCPTVVIPFGKRNRKEA